MKLRGITVEHPRSNQTDNLLQSAEGVRIEKMNKIQGEMFVATHGIP